MTIDRAKLRELLAKASPAPWKCSDDVPGDVVVWGPKEKPGETDSSLIGNVGSDHPSHDNARVPGIFDLDQANGELIAEMRNSLEELLDANEKLEAQLDICWHRATKHSVSCQTKRFLSANAVPCSCGADDLVAALAALDVVEQ